MVSRFVSAASLARSFAAVPGRLRGLVLAAGVIAAGMCASADGQSITALPIPANIAAAHATGMSADGSVVVGQIIRSNGTGSSGFYWSAGTGTLNMGNLAGGNDGWPLGVSGNGQVAAGSEFSTLHGWSWTRAGGFRQLAGAGLVECNGASFNGSVLVGDAGGQAVRWTSPTTALSFPPPPGLGVVLESSAFACSSDASVIVLNAYADGGGGWHALRWQSGAGNGSTIDIGRLPGNGVVQPTGITPDGAVVIGVSANDTPFSVRSFRWTTAGMIDLGTLDGADANAKAVSADGNTIVGVSGQPPATRPFIWTQVGGIQDLQVYLASRGVDLTGWSLRDAVGISADARTISGWGVHNGVDTSYVATFCAGACRADFNCSGGLEVQDIFAFLNAWFSADPRADFNGNGLSVQDIFDFLGAWFAGC